MEGRGCQCGVMVRICIECVNLLDKRQYKATNGVLVI